jgi:hypothetical protein
MSRPPSSGTPVALVASIAGHLVFAAIASITSEAIVVPLGDETSIEVTIEDEPREEPIEAEPEPEMPETEMPEPAAAAEAPPSPMVERARTVRDPVVREEPVREQRIEPPTMYEVEVSASDLVRREARSDSAIVFDAEPVPTRDRPVRSRTGRPGSPSGEALARQLDQSLAETANARSYVTRRPPPELRPRADGGYAFTGHAFDAVIRPDGEVVFEDRPPVSVDGFGQFGFDVNDAIQRSSGQDPYRAEREWFMNETEEVRDRLASRAGERIAREALNGLDDRMRRVWASSRAAADRRRALFEMWDECAEDETGAEARRRIVSFIRRELAEGSADEFRTDELTRLNRTRTSRARFEPYE